MTIYFFKPIEHWRLRCIAAEAECRRLRRDLTQALIFIAKNNPDLIRGYEIKRGRPMQ